LYNNSQQRITTPRLHSHKPPTLPPHGGPWWSPLVTHAGRKRAPLSLLCARTTGIRCTPTCAGEVIRPIRRRILRKRSSCVCWKDDILIALIRKRGGSDPLF